LSTFDEADEAQEEEEEDNHLDEEDCGQLRDLIDIYSSTPPRTRIKNKNRSRDSKYKM
jgi:hypothetical protein